MTNWICATCAVEYPDTNVPPACCPICQDERQYVPAGGQRWTSRSDLADDGYQTQVERLEPNLYSLTVSPRLGIGQRGLLVCTSAGNLLWEPPGFLDDAAIDEVRELGGISAISASHPHLTGASIQWSHAFGGAPVLVASADRRWIQRPDAVIELWAGTHSVLPGVTFVQCGGHFAGSSVAHWEGGAGGRGALLTGDTIGIGADRTSVTAMRSFPNYIPLPERSVRTIIERVAPYGYDRLYGAFSSVDGGAERVVKVSLTRYIMWLRGDVPDEPPE